MSGNKLQEFENRLWAAADELRANSDLTAQQYSGPVLGLIFLRYADARFSAAQEELEKAGTKAAGARVSARRTTTPAAYSSCLRKPAFPPC